MSLMNLFETSLEIVIVVSVLFALLQWLFIYTAVKAASKKAIIEAYLEIEKLKQNPSKSASEDLQEELEGWD